MPESEQKKDSSREFMGRAADAWTFFRYNMANIFAGRSIYFMILAVAVFLAVMILNLVNRDTALSGEQVYNLLLIPGVLLIFYPSAFAIQSDKDAQMIETLFGIPDYRYKIWLARYLTLYLTAAAVLFSLAAFCRVGLADFSLAKMVLQLMFPIVFLGSLAFFIASLTASGISTAVILVVTILFFWLAAQGLEESSWNLFHNPFASVDQIKTLIWAKTTFLNRMYLALGSVVLTMLALLRLQKREKFI